MAQIITWAITKAYWSRRLSNVVQTNNGSGIDTQRFELLQALFTPIVSTEDFTQKTLQPIDKIAAELAQLDTLEAGYRLGSIYTSLLPPKYRSQFGVYYTPVSLTNCLLDMSEAAGVSWRDARILDPACGGGAFLAPLARRMRTALGDMSAPKIIEHIASSLKGFEIDPFGAWLSQVMLEVELLDVCLEADRRLPICVEVKDTLAESCTGTYYDLIIGNPPYGRIKLSSARRKEFSRSLYGHANMYGLFVDKALQMLNPAGVIAFITPTSFLSGQYFKNLRQLLSRKAPPHTVNFVQARTGVFDDVLQETLLATYCHGNFGHPAEIHELSITNGTDAKIEVIPVGRFVLPENGSDPWILPRSPAQNHLTQHLDQMPHRLSDYGFRVKTGPLVWNRHKSQLRDEPGENRFPLVWAEAITPDGQFVFRAEKKNHKPFFEIYTGDEWLIIRQDCILLQRTTAKEQRRRLIAAYMPPSFIAQYGAVVVENHLNMVITTKDHDGKSPAPLVIATLLNSRTVDQVFRCISGSVAVSAYELESLPLPDPRAVAGLAQLLQSNAPPQEIEEYIEQCYPTTTNNIIFRSICTQRIVCSTF